jgi:hypothetical protein
MVGIQQLSIEEFYKILSQQKIVGGAISSTGRSIM